MKFIKSKDGGYHNIINIRSFYVGGSVDAKFRICFSYEYATKCDLIGYYQLSLDYDTSEECQKALDELIDCL